MQPMASIFGVRKAVRISSVRPKRTKSAPAMGTDQMIRCATTSAGEMWLSIFI